MPGDPQAHELAWLAGILEVVRERKGIDFGGYRAATLVRRVRNRMIAARVPTLPAYLDRLRLDPDEPDALLERLTIKVSRFFRDAATFGCLRRALQARRDELGGRALDAWSAGCGNGEEAYSLAMVLAGTGQQPARPEVVATDVDPAALAAASRGSYPRSALAEVPVELVSRYFEIPPEGGAVRVHPELHRRVEFHQHDLAGSRSAPGERRFDLVSCRNVLIYLNRPLQHRVERLLAESLRPGGLLLLGEAEWLLPGVEGAFAVIDRRARLFRLRADGHLGRPT